MTGHNANGTQLTAPVLSSISAIAVYISLALAILLYNINRAIANRKFAAENGCKPPLNRFPHIPFLFGLDFIFGNVKAFRQNRFLRLLQGRHEEIGWTFSARALARRGIFTIDPENVKSVLSLRFKDYCLGDRPPIMGPLLGHGIFVSDGDEWAHSRALLRPNFVKDQIADLHLVNKHIEDLLSLIPSGESVDLQPLFLRFTLDSATEFLFGQSTNTLAGADPNNLAFSEAFNHSLKDMALQFRMGPFRKLRRRNAGAEDAHRVCRAYVDRFVDQAMVYREKPMRTLEDGDKPERKFFLAELAKSTDDKEKIRDELLNILIAGRDTVASLLSSLFHVLARRPDVWKNIRDEVKGLEGNLPTYAQLRDLKYSKFCINEALRLWPPVPSNTRVAVRDTVLPHGGGPDGDEPIHVPKGCVVIYSTYAMHRRKDLFGDDAEEYKPERWESHKYSWEYLPFNGGPRICLGQQYALTEALLVLTRFAQEFREVETRDSRPWGENLTLTVSPAGGVKVALVR